MPLQEKLRAIYRLQDTLPKLIEDESIPTQKMDDYYVNLQILIDNKEGQKRPIELAGLFNEVMEGNRKIAESANKVLIVGGAGIGKTTFLHNIAFKWSGGSQKGPMFNDKFDYVLKVKLKLLLSEWNGSYSGGEYRDNPLGCFIHYCLWQDAKAVDKKLIPTPAEIFEALENPRTLLLLDGYDEVAHLATSPGRVKDAMDEIFTIENVLMTSRPNAIDRTMEGKFNRKIESTGLDQAGVESYIRNYFKESYYVKSGEDLLEIVNKYPNIRELIATPINAIMLCLIFSDSEIQKSFEGDFTINTLYEGVIIWLGRRYEVKITGGHDHLTKERIFSAVELKVLEAIAYDGFSTNKLVIEGGLIDEMARTIGEKRNVANDRVEGSKPFGIESIHRYGILKTERVSERVTLNRSGDATKLCEQDYAFVHLSFQEYLTALSLQDRLTHGLSVNKAATFIAEHRNEPRYLVTLKFLAGLITKLNNEDAVRAFWEAMTCNVEGVIELGVEKKVELLMHLLSQAKVRDAKTSTMKIDGKIPNIESIIQLIDVVVLSDLVNWGERLKATDYLSDNIRQALLNGMMTGGVSFNYMLIERIRETAAPDIREAIETIIRSKAGYNGAEPEEQQQNYREKIQKSCIETVGKLITKYKEEDHVHIKSMLLAVLKEGLKVRNNKDKEQKRAGANSESKGRSLEVKGREVEDPESSTRNIARESREQSWQLTKQAIECMAKMLKHIRLEFSERETLIKLLAPKIIDENYRESIVKVIVSLRNVSRDPGEHKNLLSIVLDSLTPLLSDRDRDVREAAASGLSSVGSSDKELGRRVIETLTRCFSDSNWGVREDAASYLSSVGSSDKELGRRVIETLTPLLSDSDWWVRLAAANCLSSLGSSDKELGQLVIKPLTRLLSDRDGNVRGAAAFRGIAVYWLSRLGSSDKELGQLVIKPLTRLLSDRDSGVRKAAAKGLSRIGSSDKELGQRVIKPLARLLSDSDSDVREAAADGLISLGSRDKELGQLVIQTLTGLLSAWDRDVRKEAARCLSSLGSRDKELGQQVIKPLTGLLSTWDRGVRKEAARCLSSLGSLSEELGKLVIERLTRLLSDRDRYVRVEAAKSLSSLLGRADKELGQRVIETLTGLLSDSDRDVRYAAADGLSRLGSGDKELGQLLIETLTRLLSDSDRDVRRVAAEGLSSLGSLSEELGQILIETLTPLLRDRDEDVRKAAADGLSRIGSKNKELGKLLIEPLTGLLSDSDSSVRYAAADGLISLGSLSEELGQLVIEPLTRLLSDDSKYMRKASAKGLSSLGSLSEELGQLVIETLTPLLSDSDSRVRIEAAYCLSRLGSSDKELGQLVIESLTGLLSDSDWCVRKAAQKGLAELMANLVQPNLLDYLDHQDKGLRDEVAGALAKSFKEYLERLDVLEKLLQSKENLDIERITKELFTIKLPRELFTTEDKTKVTLPDDIKIQIEQELAIIAASQDKNLSRLKEILLSGIDKIGFVKSHELIEYMLAAIGHEDVSNFDATRKQMVDLAEKIINYQIDHLSDEGLDWCNKHVDDLFKLSKETKIFMARLYHKIVGDLEITALDQELIIKLINQGMTTSLTKNGEIIFEGKKYSVHGKDENFSLDEIASAVIKNGRDVLAPQYNTHKPLFPMSSKDGVSFAGMRKAATDIMSDKSIVDGEELRSEQWYVSLLHLSDHLKLKVSKVFILLERRSYFGEHMIKKVTISADGTLEIYDYGSLHPESLSEVRKSVFGEMEYVDGIKPRYYSESLFLDYREVEQHLREQQKVNETGEYRVLHKLMHIFKGEKSESIAKDKDNWLEYVKSEKVKEVKETKEEGVIFHVKKTTYESKVPETSSRDSQIEEAMGIEGIKKFRERASKGLWTVGGKGGDKSCQVIFGKEYLKDKLKKDGVMVNDTQIDEARIILFKHLAEVAADSGNIECIKCFRYNYYKLVEKIAKEHPLYFKTEVLARAAISDKDLRTGVITKIKESLAGDGGEEYQHPSYWHQYSQDGMERMLKLRLELVSGDGDGDGNDDGDGAKVELLLIDGGGFYDENTSKIIAKEIASKSAKQLQNGVEKLLIPLNLYGKHWVGMTVELVKEDEVLDGRKSKIIVSYMDSEASPMPKSLQESLRVELAGSYPNMSIEIIEKEVGRQESNNCGLETIENLVAEATEEGVRISQEETLAMHSTLYEQYLIEEYLREADTGHIPLNEVKQKQGPTEGGASQEVEDAADADGIATDTEQESTAVLSKEKDQQTEEPQEDGNTIIVDSGQEAMGVMPPNVPLPNVKQDSSEKLMDEVWQEAQIPTVKEESAEKLMDEAWQEAQSENAKEKTIDEILEEENLREQELEAMDDVWSQAQAGGKVLVPNVSRTTDREQAQATDGQGGWMKLMKDSIMQGYASLTKIHPNDIISVMHSIEKLLTGRSTNCGVQANDFIVPQLERLDVFNSTHPASAFERSSSNSSMLSGELLGLPESMQTTGNTGESWAE